MRGVKKLENSVFAVPAQPDPYGDLPRIEIPQQNNVFLIDWLTFVAHGDTVEYLKWLLGLDSPEIPWETTEKFRNGYPMQSYWNGITFSYGADDERFYKDPSKVRHDMGVCVNFSGTGCRAFETYGNGDWFRLLGFLFRDTSGYSAEHFKLKSYNITRLDLAYDDHIGILDIVQLKQDTEDRCYVSRSTYTEIIWSDDQREDIQGVTIQVGSDKSDIKIRIYNKAAERGFKDRHWIRCEFQLRRERALEAGRQLLERNHIGQTAAGILRNYLTFRVKSSDSNRSRWPMAPYWDKLLMDMEKIKLWISPGEPYNFSKTEYWLIRQYGQAIVVMDQLHDPDYLVQTCKDNFPLDKLAPKYRKFLAKLNDPEKQPESPPEPPDEQKIDHRALLDLDGKVMEYWYDSTLLDPEKVFDT